MSYEIRAAVAEASAETTTPERLRELAKSPYLSVRRNCALNPSTPVDLLYDFSAEFPNQFLKNVTVQLLLVDTNSWIHNLSESGRVALAKSEIAPESLLFQLSNDNSDLVRSAVAENKKTPLAILQRLLEMNVNCRDIAINIVLNHNCSEDLFEEAFEIADDMLLSEDSDSFASAEHILEERIRLYETASRHPHRPSGMRFDTHWMYENLETLRRERLWDEGDGFDLDEEGSESEDYLSISNYSNDSDICQLKLSSKCQGVSTSKELLDILLQQQGISESVIIWAQGEGTELDRQATIRYVRSPQCSEAVLYRFSEHADADIRLAVTENLGCPEELIWYLAQDWDPEVCLSAFDSSECSEEIFEALSEEPDLDIYLVASKHPRCPYDWLKSIIDIQPSYWHLCLFIARSPELSEEILWYLSQHSNEWVRREVAAHPNCSKELLECLHEDDDVTVREAVLEHLNCPINILLKYWDDEIISVKDRIAAHSECPDSLLLELAKDETRVVRECANINLASRKVLPHKNLDSVNKLFDYKSEDNTKILWEKWIDKALSNSRDIRLEVAASIDAPKDVLRLLARGVSQYCEDNDDDVWEIRLALAENPNCPKSLLRVLVLDGDEEISRAAKNTLLGHNHD